MRLSAKEQEMTDVLETTEVTDLLDLVLFNDDVNTFEHVITTLVRVCRHTHEQAEQCAYIVHYRGKCTVKNGTLEELRPMRDAICEVGIDARIL